jgi:hypothetical protein
MTNALMPNCNLRLEVKFEEALKTSMTLITFAVFDGIFEIDKDRNVYVNDF